MRVDKRLKLVSPLWYEKIKNAKTIAQLLRKSTVDDPKFGKRGLDLSQPACCMVGESHDFSGEYYNTILDSDEQYTIKDGCPTCTRLSTNVYHVIRDENNMKDFRSIITEYLDHIEEQHGVHLIV